MSPSLDLVYALTGDTDFGDPTNAAITLDSLNPPTLIALPPTMDVPINTEATVTITVTDTGSGESAWYDIIIKITPKAQCAAMIPSRIASSAN